MRNIGSNTNVNFVESDIVPQLLRSEGCVDIQDTGSQVSCSYPLQGWFGYCSMEKIGIEVQSLILM